MKHPDRPLPQATPMNIRRIGLFFIIKPFFPFRKGLSGGALGGGRNFPPSAL
jgi:hypothetical protein